jgi:predicted SAM-dependent methyltransferase
MINIFDRSLPLPDKSVDIVFHEDFIEHLDQREQFQFLSEMLRVMKKGAVHRINTPNLLTALKGKSNFSKGMEGVYVDEWLRWGHKNVLTPTTLKEMAITVGYSKVVFNKRDGSISKLTPLEYRPASDRSSKDGNIFADLIK